jgi:phospholipid/cholesterol/gamma-HCH transport system permease protein
METTTKKAGLAGTQRYVISNRADRVFIELSRVFSFVARFFREVFLPPYELREVVRQCYEIGVRSLPLISLTGFIMGIVFTNQSRPSLEELGATGLLPALIAVAIVRALAPLVTALIATGRVGSNIGAELGSMKVTEQIDALEVSAINPFKYLVVTGFVNIHANELTSFASYTKQVFDAISFLDIFSAVAKATIFGFTIGMVGCYKGYNSSKGTEGVGRAANTSVVTSMFLIFIEELLALQVINALR